MGIKTLVAALVALSKSVPVTVLMALVIIAETTYIGIDHYVADLSPNAILTNNDKLTRIDSNVEYLLMVFNERCSLIEIDNEREDVYDFTLPPYISR